MLEFDNITVGVGKLNKNGIITHCSADLVNLFNQPSILRHNAPPFSQKYFETFSQT